MSEAKQEKQEPKLEGYAKSQLLQSKQYSGVQKDILNIVLKDGRYTHEQAQKAIADFNKRKVK